MTPDAALAAERPFTAKRIRKARKHYIGMTQRELAAILAVEQVSVSRWERGEAEPKIRYVREIARLAELPINWFYPGVDVEAVA